MKKGEAVTDWKYNKFLSARKYLAYHTYPQPFKYSLHYYLHVYIIYKTV